MGHYFNLEHLWGPNRGGCNEDDFVADTPPQASNNFGCPIFPEFDNCTGSGNGVNFSNYMDYTDDRCMTMFTAGQKVRMLAALNGPRSGLLSGGLCDVVSSFGENLLSGPSFRLYPNPASDQVQIELPASHRHRHVVQFVSFSGKTVLELEITEATVVETSALSNGLYFVMISGRPTTAQKLIINH